MSEQDFVEVDTDNEDNAYVELEPGMLEGENVTMEDDGSAIVNLDGKIVAPPIDQGSMPFEANLTSILEDKELDAIGSKLVMQVESDDEDRSEWRETYKKGLEILGLRYEERTEPWPGACGVFHPLLLESVLRFQAETMSEVFPASGPAKTEIVGRITEQKEKQAKRIQKDLNYQITRRIKGYFQQTEMLLFNLPLAGTCYRRTTMDPLKMRLRKDYIIPEHLIMPFKAASLEDAERHAIVLPQSTNMVKKLQAIGFYREVALGEPVQDEPDTQEMKDRITGTDHVVTSSDDLDHTLYECYYELVIDGLLEARDGIAKPYIVTVDRASRKVLRIIRNWEEEDQATEAVVHTVEYKYMPGLDAYGLGLIHILGGLSRSATSIIRQLIDAGTLSNIPAGYKVRGLRVKGDSDPIRPGEWRDVDVPAGTLKESFFPLPYGEPSVVLAGLLDKVVDEGRRIGSVADMKVSDLKQDAPVGTTLAIIERSMKIMSAVEARVYNSVQKELEIDVRLIKKNFPDQYEMELNEGEEESTRTQDYDDRVDVLPVANPNAATMALRIMKMQAAHQLSQSQPSIYDQKRLHRRMLMVMDIENPEELVPSEDDIMPMDPISENMAILTGKPVKAGMEQDHEAHIIVHMAAVNDPMLQEQMAENPAAPIIAQAAAAHIQEHLAFQYRYEIEQQLGVPLPPPGEPLPADIEVELSRLVAKAADKLMGKHLAEVQEKEILDKLEDPVIQNQTRETDIKEAEVERKRLKDQTDAALRAREIESRKEIAEEGNETQLASTILQAEITQEQAVTQQQIEGAKLGVEMVEKERDREEAAKERAARPKETGDK